jgi:hypothetical protein
MKPDEKTRARAIRLLVCVSVLSAGLSSQAHAQVGACSRACLEDIMDDYLTALVANDASLAPLAEGARYSENGQQIGVGRGLWRTASKDTSYRLYFTDALRGQVGLIGVIEENDSPAIAAFRLRVENGLITEAETIVNRVSSGGLARIENFVEPLPILTRFLEPSERTSRAVMMSAANAYFTGLDEENAGTNVPFDERCQRRENGAYTARSPDAEPGSMAALGCKAQFDTGFSVIVTDVRERRYPIIDEERGLVFSIAFFDHSGAVESYGRPDGSVQLVTGVFRRPLTFMLGELFKIVGGEIRQVEVVLLEVPYRMPSGWAE